MSIAWFLLVSLSFVAPATYDFAWDARELKYTCDGLEEQTDKEWILNGDSCVHFSDESFSFEDASKNCGTPSFSSSSALVELSWLQLRLLPVTPQRYWTALKFNDAQTLLDSTVITSIFNPSWADTEPTSLQEACVAIDLSLTSSKDRGWHFEDCSTKLPVVCQTFACIGDEFRCADNTRCIPKAAVNDGFEDCLDGSDEASTKAALSASLNISRAARLASQELASTMNPKQLQDVVYICPLPQDLRDVGVEGTAGYGVGDVITWQCNAGFTPRSKQGSICVKNVGWEPAIECIKLDCNKPDSYNLTHYSGTYHGDRATYMTASTPINSELTRVAVCDEGDWVFMNDELIEYCMATPFKYGHYTKEKYKNGEEMEFECEKDFYPSSFPATCGLNSEQPVCNPTPIKPSDCDGTIQLGPPLFVRNWCACAEGGVEQGGECVGFKDSCSSEQDTCSFGQTCQRNETLDEDYHCACPAGKCLYPVDDCAKEAFLPDSSYNAKEGECATLRCSLDSLKWLVPSNCAITTYNGQANEVDMRLGSTDVFCAHAFGGEQVQTRHIVQCINGQWEGADAFNKMCNATYGMLFDAVEYEAFDVTSMRNPQFYANYMSIRCGGDGEWMGEVPVDHCEKGSFQIENNLVRCVCVDGWYGPACDSPCDQGTMRSDGSCDCNGGFHGKNCEIDENCLGELPSPPFSIEQKLHLVFIIDLYQAGFAQFVTASTGLLYNMQQLIRDISYYDNQFIGNVTLIAFGTKANTQPPQTFLWSAVDQFVAALGELKQEDSCTMGLDQVLDDISAQLKAIPPGSIVNLFTAQPAQYFDEGIIDAFVSQGIIANIITDSSVVISDCPTAGDLHNYMRLAKLTGGYYLDGMSPADFLRILPKFYKSSIVLLPALMQSDADADFPFTLDAGAQSVVAFAHNDYGGSSTPTFTISSRDTVPSSLDFSSDKEKDRFQVLYNSNDGVWQANQFVMTGYMYHSKTGEQYDWQGAIDYCESLGGTVADFTGMAVCPDAVPGYWMPISLKNGEWYASYRSSHVPVAVLKFYTPPTAGQDCAYFDCISLAWMATSCKDLKQALCQRSVFNPQKPVALGTDDIRPGIPFTMTPTNVKDAYSWYSVRVQSNTVFSYSLTDKYGNDANSIHPGATVARMNLGFDYTSLMYATVIDDSSISRAKLRPAACKTFSSTTLPMFCTGQNDVTVQITTENGAAIRAFKTRCSNDAIPGTTSPPADCAATGCIAANTDYCYVNANRAYKCACKTGFTGYFCEQQTIPTTCVLAELRAEVNDAGVNSNIKIGDCGCKSNMKACTDNRWDACDGQCLINNGDCVFTNLPPPTPDPFGNPTVQQAVAACVCKQGFEGEFCDRKQAYDCNAKPCHNGAECEQTFDPNGFRCNCTAGFTGEYCDIPLGLCTPDTCDNGGTCYDLDPISMFCLCKDGYEGDRCERLLDLGCLNGGVRKPDGTCVCPIPWDGAYCTLLKDPMPLEVCDCAEGSTCVYDVKAGVEQISCICPDFRVGDKCERLQLPCTLAPCGPHGTCIAQPNEHEYKCKCDEDYAGDLCDVFVGGDGCKDDDCLNGGTCNAEGKCDCPEPYTGTHCQTTLPCLDYCSNGGTCDVVGGRPVCRCSLRYTGKQCTEEVDSRSYNIEISPTVQRLGYDINNLDSVFSICAWVRATPRKNVQKPEMPIFTVNFGRDQLRVTTAKATVRGASAGNLALQMHVWQTFCVRCTNTQCNAFANGISLGTNLFASFSGPSDTLFIAPVPIAGETPFTGEISRFSIYNRAITDKEAASFAFNCASTIAADETADDLWWSILDPVPRSALVSPGLCESSPCWPGTCSTGNDKFPPMATFCPTDMFLNSSRPKSITWPEPVFEDDRGIVKIDSNYRSGDIFVWGEHHVVYTATDSSSNIGRCEFDIYLSPNDCNKPISPLRGTVQYSETFDGESGSNAMASVQCEDNRYPLDGPKFYVCDYLGQWRRSYYSPLFMPPSCGKVNEPEQTMDGNVHFDAAAFDCEQERRKVLDTIKSVVDRICPNGEAGCVEVTVSDCPTGDAIFAVRADDEPPTLSYSITILSTDPLIYQNVQSELEKIDGVHDVQIDDPAYVCSGETPLQFEDQGATLCAEVPPGFFYSAASQQKFMCPIDQYQDQSNKDSCINCPDGTITQAEGATKITDCYQNCSPGEWCDFDTGTGPTGAIDHCCTKCAKGKFSTGTGSLQCQDCKDGMTTEGVGSTHESDCIWICTTGQEVDDATGNCRNCPRGKYKDSAKAGQCLSCPSGLTTAGEKSTSASDCNVLYCPPNTYVNPNQKASVNPSTFKLADFCLPCDKGSYQPQYNATSCSKCPNTPDVNAGDLPPTCRMENECSPELDNGCGDGKKCVKWPDNSYYHCVENSTDDQSGGGSLSWWQIVLIVAGSCLGVAAVVAIAVIVAMRCCNVGKKAPGKDTDSLSNARRTTLDAFGGTVADKDDDHGVPFTPLPTPGGIEMPPVHVDPAYVYDKPLSMPPTPAVEQLPIEYLQRPPPVASAAVVRMRKRMSNVSKDNTPRNSRPFSTDTISSVPSIRSPPGRSSGNFFVPSVTIRSNSESSMDSFSVSSTRSEFRPRTRPDSEQIVHALVDALDEDRFRGGEWDRESSIL